MKRGTIKVALIKEDGFGVHGRDERMTTVAKGDVNEKDAKDAVTDYAVIATAGEEFAWLAVKPRTGRTHQIRVHLAALGTPIVGDFKYGGSDVRGKGEIENRLHLHARSIDIARPDGGRLAVTAPLPPVSAPFTMKRRITSTCWDSLTAGKKSIPTFCRRISAPGY